MRDKIFNELRSFNERGTFIESLNKFYNIKVMFHLSSLGTSVIY